MRAAKLYAKAKRWVIIFVIPEDTLARVPVNVQPIYRQEGGTPGSACKPKSQELRLLWNSKLYTISTITYTAYTMT